MDCLVREMENAMMLFAIGGLLSLGFVSSQSVEVTTNSWFFMVACAAWVVGSAIVLRALLLAFLEPLDSRDKKNNK